MIFLRFLLRRVAQFVVTVVALLLIVFFVVRLAPGGPAQSLLGAEYYTPERAAELNRQLGLDRPLPEQLVRWLTLLVTGDLGYSYFFRRPAIDVVLERLSATALLGGLACLLSVLGGVTLGVCAAMRRGSAADRLIGAGAVGVLATPAFWLGILLIVVFAAWLRLLPSSGVAPVGREDDLIERGRHLLLPLLAVAARPIAALTLYTRTAVVETLASDYVRTARAKGLSARRIAYGHALRNAAIPIITLAGLQLPIVVEGSVVIETVFSWPGLGFLTVASVGRRDYPILLVITLLVALVVSAANFLTDVLHRYADPRLDYR